MQDAVKVVRRLSYRFIWIDAVCIIQDSTQDWLYEASEMSRVCSNAIVTLAAAHFITPGQGMFRARHLQSSRPFPFSQVERSVDQDLRHLTIDVAGDDGVCYVFPATKGVHSGSRPKGVLNTRRWILQEQLLSPRILYYDQHQLYWDCVTQSASELSPVSSSLLKTRIPTKLGPSNFCDEPQHA